MAKKNQTKKQTSKKKVEEVKEIKEEVTEETESVEKADEAKEDKPNKKKRNDSKKSNKNSDKKSKNEKSHWFKDFKAEIKKIVWPSGKRLFDNVVVVLSMVIVVTLIIVLLDLGLKQLSGLEVNGINELKTRVHNEVETIDENTTSDDALVNGTDGEITTITNQIDAEDPTVTE